MDLTERVARRLKLRDLRLFETVVRVGSMVKAANQLHLSQPAVSKAIAEMEQTIGVRLIDRGRQGVEPTPHGRALLKSSAAIFDQLRHGVMEIEYLSDPTVGEVRIATSEPFAAGLVLALIAKFSKSYPRVLVFVVQSPISSLSFQGQRYRELHDRSVDLVIGPIIDAAAGGDLDSETLYEEPLIVAAGAHNPWTRKRKVGLRDLIDEPWCLPPSDTPVGLRCVEAFQANGLDPPRTAIASISVQVQIGVIATGGFLTMLPNSLIRFSGERLGIKALPVRLAVRSQLVGITTLRNRTISPVAQMLAQMAREITKPLATPASSRDGPAKVSSSA